MSRLQGAVASETRVIVDNESEAVPSRVYKQTEQGREIWLVSCVDVLPNPYWEVPQRFEKGRDVFEASEFNHSRLSLRVNGRFRKVELE